MMIATQEVDVAAYDPGFSHDPPTGERMEDFATVARHIFKLLAVRAARSDLRGISPEALATLESSPFMGSREALERALEQSITFAVGPYVTRGDLPEEIRRIEVSMEPLHALALPPRGLDLRSTVEDLETRMILQALERTGWNKNRASRLLGLNRTTLVEMIKRKRLTPPVGVRNLRNTAVANTVDAHTTDEDEVIAAE